VVSLCSETPVLLRPGTVSKEEVERVLGRPLLLASMHSHEPVSSPGMKYRHYCPQTPIKLFYTLNAVKEYLDSQDRHLLRMFLASAPQDVECDHFPLCAKEFYALL